MTNALVASWAESKQNQLVANLFAVLGGVALISLLAQVVIPVPWTPVPITGQTFAVSLIGLCWGFKRGIAVMASYLAIGAAGAPVFASSMSGLILGPTFGYIVGMFAAVMIVGKLSDAGIPKTFYSSLATAYLGSFLIFAFGLLGLSFYVPSKELLIAGLWPFVFGDLVKNIAAASIHSKLQKS